MPHAQGEVTPDYQVAIVGGGIAGLTLALAFEKLGIQFVLFEARDSLAPNEGASIGLQPNGLRILDQLGLIDDIDRCTAPLRNWRHLDEHGRVISSIDALSHYPSMFGYGGLFLERQKLLEIMSSHVRNRDSLKVGSRVVSLEEAEDHVAITTSNGVSITAELVVGADGVRSCVRQFFDSMQTENRRSADDYMSTSFSCVYGISHPLPGISEGQCFSVYREGATLLGFTGKDAIIFWFVFEDLGREFSLSETPRYCSDDVDQICHSVAHLQVAPSLQFGDIFAARKIAMKIALEEGIAKTWHTDRAVIVGDATHKMVPNAAMGANQAIESSALLVNEVLGVLKSSRSRPSRDALRAALIRYRQKREPRTTETQKRARMSCLTQLRHGGLAETSFQELPTLTDKEWLFRGLSVLSNAPVLNSIPLSARGRLYDQAVESFSN